VLRLSTVNEIRWNHVGQMLAFSQFARFSVSRRVAEEFAGRAEQGGPRAVPPGIDDAPVRGHLGEDGGSRGAGGFLHPFAVAQVVRVGKDEDGGPFEMVICSSCKKGSDRPGGVGGLRDRRNWCPPPSRTQVPNDATVEAVLAQIAGEARAGGGLAVRSCNSGRSGRNAQATRCSW
jgi:hypothetical protein